MIDEALKEFLIESSEALDLLDRELLALERAPSSVANLAALFRAVHTIKGTAGCLGLARVESLSHVGETLMARAREGTIALTPPRISALLAMSDTLRALLSGIESGGDDTTVEVQPIIDRLTLVTEGAADAGPAKIAPGKQDRGPDAAKDQPAAAEAEQHKAPPSALAASENSLRVDVALLDRLMNLVGELVLARNQILQVRGRVNDVELTATSQRLNAITTQLQESVTKTRMQPIGQLFGKLPRVVRDLALACGKQARLETKGEDTELDKALLEAIKDPITHLVRNGLDHGIEKPEVRLARGKPAEGVIRLSAWHEGGQVNIVLADDGGGIDPARLKAKAVAAGFITPEQAARLTDHEAFALIFLPGFSTAEKVTQVSGRGVGMDVVRINVERIGGTVEVSSVLGQGSQLKLRIPLTLAIVPALVVRCGGERYAIPQISLLEIVRLGREGSGHEIEKIRESSVFRLRGRLLPVIGLREVLGLPPGEGSGRVHLVVLQSQDQQFGLLVDSIEDSVEIVVKPLGRHLKSVPLFAGATILGDGKTALILDVRAVAQAASLHGDAHRAEAVRAPRQENPGEPFLICCARDGGHFAIPLTEVSRLEEIAEASVERLADREVVQHRGEILPLLRLQEELPERRTGDRSVHSLPASHQGSLQVVVHSEAGASVGLVVETIVDIVTAVPAARRESSRPGVAYVAVIADKVTEVIDVRALCRRAAQPLPQQPAGAKAVEVRP